MTLYSGGLGRDCTTLSATSCAGAELNLAGLAPCSPCCHS
jgi:hypothetical protein